MHRIGLWVVCALITSMNIIILVLATPINNNHKQSMNTIKINCVAV